MPPPERNQSTDSTCEEHSLPTGDVFVLPNSPFRSIRLTSHVGITPLTDVPRSRRPNRDRVGTLTSLYPFRPVRVHWSNGDAHQPPISLLERCGARG